MMPIMEGVKKSMGWHVDRAIVEAVKADARQTHDQLAGLAGIAPRTLRNHLPGLIEDGVIQRTGTGQRGSYQYRVDKDKARELGYLA